MKKITGLLALIMVVALCAGALAAPGDANLFYRMSETEAYTSIRAAASDGANLYVLKSASDGRLLELIRYDYQRQTTEILADDLPASYASTKEDFENNEPGDINRVISNLVVSDGELYGINYLTGTVSRLAVEEGALAFTLAGTFDTAPLMNITPDYTYRKQIRGVIKQGDNLYIATYTHDSAPNAVVYRFDLKAGTTHALSNAAVTEMTPYKDGTALALIYDPQTSYDEITNTQRPREIHTLDLATGASKKLYDLNVASCGIAYDAQTDTLYYAQGSQIMARKANGATEKVAYLPSSDVRSVYCAAYANGLYTVADSSGVAIRNIDPSFLPAKVLTIYGSGSRLSDIAFLNAHPDVALNHSESYFESADLLAQALSASSDIDVVLVYMDSVTAFIDKGFCADMTFSQALTVEAGKIYPYLTDFASRDGKLYAVPVTGYQSVRAYAPGILREIGLTEADLPTTYEALFQFITRWNDELSYDFPDYTPLFVYNGLRETLLDEMISDYALYYQSIGENLTFSTPLFESLIKAFGEMRTDNLVREDMTEDDIWSMSPLFDVGYFPVDFTSSDPAGHEGPYNVPWVFKLAEDLPVVYGTQSDYMFINPNSKNKDEAAAYLAGRLQDMDTYNRPIVFASMTEPVENPDYPQMIKSWQDDLALLKKQLETAPESDRAAIESQIANYEEMLSNSDRDRDRYQITSQALAYYKEHIVDKSIVANDSLRYSSDWEVLKPIMQRFLDKQLTGGQFINELEKIMRMIVEERK